MTAEHLVFSTLYDYCGDNCKFGYDTTLLDLDLDSLDAVRLLMEIEEKSDVEIDVRNLDKVKTVGELVQLVEKHLPK